MNNSKNLKTLAIGAVLVILPLILQQFGNAWVRLADMALLYVLLAVGLNIVVGYAGLLDLGYIAFFAVGAYTYALAGSPHLALAFPATESAVQIEQDQPDERAHYAANGNSIRRADHARNRAGLCRPHHVNLAQ